MTLRTLSLLPALALGLLLSAPAAADPGVKWEQINREDGITVYSKTVEGSDLVAFKGEATIKEPLGKVLSVLMTHERWGEWVDRMSGSKILETVSTYEYIVYQAFELPVFVSDRDYVYRGTVTRNAKGQVILNMTSCEWKSAPETVGVRAKLLQSRYVLTPKGKSQTTVEVEIHTDPKGMVPAWLVNQIQKSWPINTLNGIRQQAQRKDVKSFPPPPLVKPTPQGESKAEK